jgi:hypothetical protein
MKDNDLGNNPLISLDLSKLLTHGFNTMMVKNNQSNTYLTALEV